MSLVLEIDVDNKGAIKGIKASGKAVTNLEEKTQKASKSIKAGFNSAKASILGWTAAIGVGVVAFNKIIVKTTEYQDQIAKTSKAIGISTKSLSALAFAAERSGTNLASVTTGLRLLQRRASDANQGLETAARSFRMLNISVTDSNGNLRDSEDLLLEIADRFSNLTNETQKSALAQELFGRSGTMLIPLLNEGKDGIEALTKEAARLGVVIDSEAAQAAEEFQDNLTNLKSAFSGVAMEITRIVVPAINRFFGSFRIRKREEDTVEDQITALKRYLEVTDEGAESMDEFNAKLGERNLEILTRNFHITSLSVDDAKESLQELIAVLGNISGDDGDSDPIKNMAGSASELRRELRGIGKDINKEVDAEMKEMLKDLKEMDEELANIGRDKMKEMLKDLKEMDEKLANIGRDKLPDIVDGTKEFRDAMWDAAFATANVIGSLREGQKLKLSSLLSVIGAVTSIFNPGAGAAIGGAGQIAGLMGFANGGSFKVGGSGGIDSQLVAFKATPGETVNVTNNNSNSVNMNFPNVSSVNEQALRTQIMPAIRRELRLGENGFNNA